jgi:tetratricopeptide (TPR) repeat protein
MFVSSDARTFTEPPAKWKPGRWESRQSYFAASPQSLTADLVRAGVTGAAGYVAEPYLDSSVRPEILFPSYVAGFNLAESFYQALPTLSWQSVVIGDPLCGPFTKTTIPADDLNPPLDKETELPALFSARRLGAADLKAEPEVIKLLVRAQSRLARQDREGARQSLEQAVELDDTVTAAWRALGLLYEETKEYDKALAAYRKVVEREPKDALSLNNLAYAMAVREGNPKEALPLAERALLLAPRNALIADTVGWIKHLLGDNAGAVNLLEPVAKALPRNAEVQLHAAAVFAGLGRVQDAAAALKAAVAADPKVTERPEYQEVQKKIGK